jgi:hypothetical protein
MGVWINELEEKLDTQRLIKIERWSIGSFGFKRFI